MSLRSYFSEPLPRGSNLLILLLVLSLATLMVLLAIISRRPTIDSVLPTEFQPGTRLTIVGSHFGEQRGAVILASQRIGANRILNWSNDRVVVEVPPGVPSGLLFVENDRGSSRGVLLTNRAEIPSADAIPLPNRPKILRVAARAPFVGGYVVISGTRLGSRQHDSAVEFTAAWSDNGPVRPPIGPTGYPRWTDDEIVARIPDGAGDGPFWLVVNGTRYLAGTLTVNRPAFGKEYGPGREIAVEHRVRYGPVGIAEDAVATSPGDLSVTLWVPEIEPFPEQGAIRAVQPLPEPTVRFGKTVSAHRRGPLSAGASGEIREVLVLKRRPVSVTLAEVVPFEWSSLDQPFIRYYTRATRHIPADAPEIREIAQQQRAGDHIVTARRLYLWVLDHLQYAPYLTERSALFGLDRSVGDHFTYATLLVALLRAAEVPSRPVSGYLVTEAGDAYPHFWTEIMIPGVGWVPLDPSLGDGNFPGSFPQPESPREFYFGSLDANRVAIAKGEAEVAPIDHDADLWAPTSPASLQTVYAEIGSLLRDVQISWDGLTVLGVY